MKKIVFLFLFFIFLFLGIIIGSKETKFDNEKFSNDLKEFEGEIIYPNNSYTGIKNIEIEGNIFGKVGKKGETIIDKGFDIAKNVIKKFVDWSKEAYFF